MDAIIKYLIRNKSTVLSILWSILAYAQLKGFIGNDEFGLLASILGLAGPVANYTTNKINFKK